MSAPTGRYEDPLSIDPYAPKWPREQRRADPHEALPDLPAEAPPLLPEFMRDAMTPDEVHQNLARRLRQKRHGLEPEVMPLPPLHARSFGFGQILRVVLLVCVASGIAYFLVGGWPAFNFSADNLKFQLASLSARPEAAPKSAKLAAAPKLITRDIQANPDVWIPLDASLQGNAHDAFVVITGLAPGTQISAGQPIGANGWRIAASELSVARFRVPQAGAGSADLTMELRLPDDTVLDRQIVRLDIMSDNGPASDNRTVAVAPSSPVPFISTATAAVPPSPEDTPQSKVVDEEELAQLLKRGQEFINTGDIASARLVLRRAAMTKNPTAAFALASTYDPTVLTRLGAYGTKGDVALARTWYERARDYGSKEAGSRLDLLARAGP